MYARDAGRIVAEAREAYARYDAAHRLQHNAYDGGHALTEDRFVAIVQWPADRRGAG